MLDDFYDAAKGADIIIYHPKALGAVDIAVDLGIACVSMPPVPITFPVGEFANLAVTHKNLGPVLNKLTYKVNEKAALEAGKHVMCEKPITVNYVLSCEMAREAESRNLFLYRWAKQNTCHISNKPQTFSRCNKLEQTGFPVRISIFGNK